MYSTTPIASDHEDIGILIFLFAIQSEKLQTLITAAKVPDVEPIWCTLFAKVHLTL